MAFNFPLSTALAPKTALEVNHERRVEFIRRNYADASVATLIGVQGVNCEDYYRYLSEGETELAARMLLQINAMGEYIDERDGTKRPETTPDESVCNCSNPYCQV